jgi:hypothetical protein
MERLERRPLGVAAAMLVAVDAAIAAFGGHFPLLSAFVLVVAPGMALVPLLPERARADWPSAVAAAPALGVAASSVALITVASAGLPLDGTLVRAVVAGIVLAGLAMDRGGEPVRAQAPAGLPVWGGLIGAVALGVLLAGRVLHGSPVPGNDWAKYALYGDEIRRHGSLLIRNPFWMLGVPFREDPGAPALYGSYLTLTAQPASVLMHGIWVFSAFTVLSVFAFVRGLWSAAAGVVAAALYAATPISQDILGWHGLANQEALVLLPLALLYAAVMARERLGLRQSVGFALLLIGLAAAHRLSFIVAGLAVATTLTLAWVVVGDGIAIVRRAALVAGSALVLCGGVLYDIETRSRTFGGTLGYADYASSRVDLGLVARDLSIAFTVAALLALVVALASARRDVSLMAPLALLLVTAALAYSWVVHLPLVYFRMAYYLPIALAPLVAVALTRLLPLRVGLLVGVALTAVVAVAAWAQDTNVRRFYSFANTASLRGLDAVAAQLRPGEVVVTDRCWSFLATWLLHTRTLAALEPQDIQPKAELVRAREAQAVLDATRSGRALQKRLGIRFAILDPTCPDAQGNPLVPPRLGEPAFISQRLVVVTLR